MQRNQHPTARLRTERAGFTLIELLVVIVILGILAAIAVPQYAGAKERAFVASMQSDLRNLAGAQAAYFVANQMFADNGDLPASEFRPSSGVSVTIDSATAIGWGAHTTHAAASTVCRIAVSHAGSSAPACEAP